MPRLTKEGIELVKRFEGLRLRPYLCPANVLTIGYGHTRTANLYPDGITREQAEELLIRDLNHAGAFVLRSVRVPLTDNQYSALVSFVFNVGGGAFQASTLLRMLNRQDYAGAANQFKRWNKVSGKTLSGLKARRSAEELLFSK